MPVLELPPLRTGLTTGQLYCAAMRVTTQEHADAYMERLIDICLLDEPNLTRAEAEKIQRTNIGYVTGYYDRETAARVEQLFKCRHPLFPASRRKEEAH